MGRHHTARPWISLKCQSRSSRRNEHGSLGKDEEVETIPCPHCRKQIHEDSQRCPHCEQYLSDEAASPKRKPWWIVVRALACLYAVYRWIAG